MDSAIARTNIAYYNKLLANEVEPERRNTLLQWLDDEKRKLTAAENKKKTKQRVWDFSQVQINGCNDRSVKNKVLSLRRGPILHNRGRTIFSEGDPSRYILLVLDGVIRTCRNYEDGKRAIAAFYLPGDTLGWDDELLHLLSVEAATNVVALYIKRTALRSLAAADSRVADFIIAAGASEIRRAREPALLVTREAIPRVAAFLYDFWLRMNKPKYLDLPVSYADAARHLGLNVETFSRAVASLERSGLIARTSFRQLVLRNQASLLRLVS